MASSVGAWTKEEDGDYNAYGFFDVYQYPIRAGVGLGDYGFLGGYTYLARALTEELSSPKRSDKTILFNGTFFLMF